MRGPAMSHTHCSPCTREHSGAASSPNRRCVPHAGCSDMILDVSMSTGRAGRQLRPEWIVVLYCPGHPIVPVGLPDSVVSATKVFDGIPPQPFTGRRCAV